MVADASLNPITYTGTFLVSSLATEVSFGSGTLRTINARANALVATDVAAEAAIDKYEFYKSAYTQQREYLIRDGAVNKSVDVLDFDEPENDHSFGPVKAN